MYMYHFYIVWVYMLPKRQTEMIIAIIYVVISFLLDGLISNHISFNLVDPSYLKTIYSVISLVILFNYFDNQ